MNFNIFLHYIIRGYLCIRYIDINQQMLFLLLLILLTEYIYPYNSSRIL